MKLATYNDGSRDGQLIVVSSDLSLAHYASDVASRLQQVLDDWNFLSPQLEDLARTLNQGKARNAFAFEPRLCMAPLPRAFERITGWAYPSHRERLRRAAGGAQPLDPDAEPLLRQARSDDFLGPHDDIVATGEGCDLDFEAELAAISGDLRRGCSSASAIEGVRLLMLASDVTSRDRAGDEPERGFGPLRGKPATAFAPVAVTPDELGAAWRAGRASLTLECHVNAKRIGRCDAAADMRFHFGDLISHLCQTRQLRAGSIVATGCVSVRDATEGALCIAERRAIETSDGEASTTQFLKFGDTVRIDARDASGATVFGAIEQRVRGADPAFGT
jgi:fumarylacetoacetate (FAA) hydrolase